MADSPTGEKTEEPSPQKMQQAREKGQVAKSQDFISALVFIGAFGVLSGTIASMGTQFTTLIRQSFMATRSPELNVSIVSMLQQSLMTWILISLPILGTAFILGLVGNVGQIGFLMTMDPLMPNLKKIDPISGFKQMFSMKKLIELLKQIVKFIAVSEVVYMTVHDSIREIILMQRIDLLSAISIAWDLMMKIVMRVGVLFMIIAAADFFWQKYQFKKGLMMSLYDVKQEYKQSEGDPHTKGERRQLAQELIMGGGQQRVKKANAVVSNPVHIAVAIEYDPKQNSAPIVTAKGMGKNADTIKELAKQYKVPVVRNVPLAQALNKLQLEEEIPPELYEAVAEIINFVAELKKKEQV